MFLDVKAHITLSNQNAHVQYIDPGFTESAGESVIGLIAHTLVVLEGSNWYQKLCAEKKFCPSFVLKNDDILSLNLIRFHFLLA